MKVAIDDTTKINILADHYKDSFQHVKQSITLRDRLMLLVIVLLALQLFQITSPENSSSALIGFFKSHLGFEVSADKNSLSAILWFSLLSVVIKYFQTNVYINRQYEYLDKLEALFTKISGESLLTREGSHYLSNYPLFSNWCHILYTWVFPILLIIASIFNIIEDFPGCGNVRIAFGISIVFCVMIIVSTTIYLYSIHCGK